MLLKDIEKQALKLPISDRRKLIQSLLTSIDRNSSVLAMLPQDFLASLYAENTWFKKRDRRSGRSCIDK